MVKTDFILTNTLSHWVLDSAQILTLSVFIFHEQTKFQHIHATLKEQPEKNNILYLQSSSISKVLNKLEFLACPFMFQWNNCCWTCTTRMVVIQRWPNDLKSWKPAKHSHPWISSHTVICRAVREEKTNTKYNLLFS